MSHFFLRASAGLLLGLSALPALAGAVRDGFDSEQLTAGQYDNTFSGAVDLGFVIHFYGEYFSQTYVGNDGNISFGAASGYTRNALTNLGKKFIAPFYADADLRPGGASLKYGQGMVDGRQAFGATWRNIGYFQYNGEKRNTFQVILIDRSDLAAGDFDIEFNYDQIQWEAGDAPCSTCPGGGTGGLGGNPSARAGYTDGVARSYELQGSGISGSLLDGGPYALAEHSLNSDVTGRYVFQARSGAVLAGSNRAPLNTVPGGQVTQTDTPLAFSAAARRLIAVHDESQTQTVELTLSAEHGTLALSKTENLSFSKGTGSNDAQMVFTGTIEQVNQALAGLVFTPASGYIGPASLTVASNDLGNGGTGGALSDSDKIDITVMAQPMLISFQPVRYIVAESAGKVSISVARSGNSAGEATVAYTTQSAIAQAGSDFTETSGTLTWADGELGAKSFDVPVLADNVTEPAETFQVVLSNPTGGAVLGNSEASVTIGQIVSNSGFVFDLMLGDGLGFSGGWLGGEIVSGGTFSDIGFLPGATLDGGWLGGMIVGDSGAPAWLSHLEVLPGSSLSYVILGEGVQLAGDVALGAGVNFASLESIPDGQALTGFLGILAAPDCAGTAWSGPAALNLNGHPLPGSTPLMDSLNALPGLAAVRQHSSFGYLHVDVGNNRYALLPLAVQRRTQQAEGLMRGARQTVKMTVTGGMEIQTQPAVQEPCALWQAAQRVGVAGIAQHADGSLKLALSSAGWISVRPDWTSQTSERAPGLYPSGHGGLLVFADESGQRRQQPLYPAPADSAAVEAFLTGFGLAYTLNEQGELSVALPMGTLAWVFDYLVSPGAPPADGKMQAQRQGQGWLLTYPNGDQQALLPME